MPQDLRTLKAKAVEAKELPVRRFRLKMSSHAQDEPVLKDGKPVLDEAGNPVMSTIVYNKGDIIKTTSNLVRKFGPEKFEALDHFKEDVELEKMNFQELVNIASEYEIDASQLTNKKDIVAAIRQAQGKG